jgi:hypothetical protein
VQQALIGPGSSFNESKLGMAGDQTDLRVVNLGLYRVGEGAYSHPHLHVFNPFSHCNAALFLHSWW